MSHYSTAFTFGIEASVYPIGFGYRGFLYIPALSRFENISLSIPSAVSTPASTDRLGAFTHTEMLHLTATVTATTTYTTTAFLITSTSTKGVSAGVIRGGM